jgi:cysteine desulfurase
LANAEVGTIQDLALIRASASNVGAIFHVDAAQALGRIKVPVNELGCDLMTLSGHKIGAPSGIGALFVRDPAQFSPLMLGGPQENGLRAGTPNLLGAVGFGAAAEAVLSSLEQEASRMMQLSELLLKLLTDAIPGIRLNGPRDRRLPNTLNLTFPSVSGETLLIALDLEGVLSSMGSACAAGAVEPSHVLLAMGRSPMQARSSLRLSLGPQNTQTEIERAAEIISRVWRTVVEAEPSKAENFDAETLA